jgi:SNF2 family DNA or RNA helicase
MMQRWQPHAYQDRAVKFLIQHPEAALLMDPGLGKTACTMKAFQALRQAKVVRKMLVVAPLRVAQLVWSLDGELGKWADFRDLTYTLLHGPKKAEALQQDVDIYVINYDGLRWLVESGGLKSLITRGVDLVIFDELSRLKHTRTERFRLLRPVLGRFKRRWGLTGSPASNGLMDLFGQVYALDLGRALGQYITHYRSKYFDPTGFGGYTWTIKPGSDKQIFKAIKGMALAMRAEDHLDLPELVERDVLVDLPPKALKLYQSMEQELIAQLEAGDVTAANAGVALHKCRQLASGGIYRETPCTCQQVPCSCDGAKRVSEAVHDAKTDALTELVDELQGSPLLIAYEFHHDLERIRKALGNVPAINGQTKQAETLELVGAWNRGELPVLAGHPQAMGHGLNLQQAGHHVCWYSLTWDYELYDQLVRRVYRQGQASRVVVHRILARQTVDLDVAAALRQKGSCQAGLFDALRARSKKRS